jgi:hypothetical protein
MAVEDREIERLLGEFNNNVDADLRLLRSMQRDFRKGEQQR